MQFLPGLSAQQGIQRALAGIFLAVMCYLIIFSDLDRTPLQQWDESRRAVNALEMIEQESWLVPYYKGKPDHMGTKPPLLPASIRISYSLFGVSEWSTRLPVALFATATVFLLWWFGIRVLKSHWTGLIAALILLTTKGYIHRHVAMTGDYDGILLFFTTLSSMAFFYAIHHTKSRWQALSWWIFAIALALGVMTKSVAGLLYTPALFIYALALGKVPKTLKNPHALLSLLTGLLIVAGYYFTREYLDPGFLVEVSKKELGGRYLQTFEGHAQPWYYYLELFVDKFYPWYFVLLPAFFFRSVRRPAIFFTLCAFVQLAVVSYSQTKLSYYEAPIYPWLAIVAALGIVYPLQKLAKFVWPASPRVAAMAPALFFVMWAWAVWMIFPHKAENMHIYPDMKIGEFIMEQDTLDNYAICYHEYNAQSRFYMHKEQHRGRNVVLDAIDYLKPGDRMVLCENVHWERLDKWWKYEILHGETRACALVRVTASNKNAIE